MNIAVPAAGQAIFNLSGQVCVAASRLYVQADIYDEFVKRAVEYAKKIKVGDPTKPDTTQGPQVLGFTSICIYIYIYTKPLESMCFSVPT